jgi:ATPase subunit of ABC transporter with duplicated ATPase domains
LSAYEGTIITISHDRYFLDRVATQILALDGLGGAEHYDGDYTEYHDWKLGRGDLSVSSVSSVPKETEPENLVSITAPPSTPQVSEARSAKPKSKPGVKVVKKKKPETRSAEQVEQEIAAAESRLNDISEQMGTPEVGRDPDRLIALNDDYQQTESLLKTLYEEWDRVSREPART